MRNNKKGFTLIELLAVIVILAILAGITAIMVTNYIEDSKINADRLNAQNITNAVLRERQVQGEESDRGVYVFVGADGTNASDLLEKPLANSPWTDKGYTTARAYVENGEVYVCLYDGSANKGVIGSYQEIAADEDLDGKKNAEDASNPLKLRYTKITKCPDRFDDKNIKAGYELK